MQKVNISKLSAQNTKLMVALANGRQDSLETQLSEAVFLDSYKLTNDESSSKASKADAKESYPGLTPQVTFQERSEKVEPENQEETSKPSGQGG